MGSNSDEDDLRVFFQHHEFVRVGELALGFVGAGRVRVARALVTAAALWAARCAENPS